MPNFTLIVPYYRNPRMLERQVAEWAQYPENVNVIVVDDGSLEPAAEVIRAHASESLLSRTRLFRITVDIPWNREGARNLGAEHCRSEWMVHVDIDHVLPAAAAACLERFTPESGRWYRFPRYRQGRADETRLKDKLPREVAFGPIHPHIDSYLIQRDTYWRAGGYDEDFSGCLGGGTEFLKRLEQKAGAPETLPERIHLHVYTRDLITDASDWSLSRDRGEGKRRALHRKAGPPTQHLRFPWVRQL